MLSHDIQSITCALKHRLRRDGEIRVIKKEAQAFIANLNDWIRRAKALERRSNAKDALRDAVGEGTIDAYRHAGCL